MNENAWEIFFGNPLVEHYLEEAENEMDNQETTSQEEGRNISDDEAKQLAADLKQNHISQDDIINMFKSGKLTRDDVKTIVDISNADSDAEAMAPEEEQPQTEEELLAQQIDQTNDLFIKFALYDKILELTEKLDFFKKNFDDITSDFYQNVLQLKEFLNILSNLVFTLETPVAYQMYGSLLLQLTELFEEYNKTVQPQRNKEEELKDIRREIIDNTDAPVSEEEKWLETREPVVNK